MICLVNPERLLRFTKREVIQPTEVNLLSMEGSDHAIFWSSKCLNEEKVDIILDSGLMEHTILKVI